MKFDPTLYVITDSTYHTTETLLHAVEEACKGGATLIQLREKDTGGRSYLELAEEASAMPVPSAMPALLEVSEPATGAAGRGVVEMVSLTARGGTGALSVRAVAARGACARAPITGATGATPCTATELLAGAWLAAAGGTAGTPLPRRAPVCGTTGATGRETP